MGECPPCSVWYNIVSYSIDNLNVKKQKDKKKTLKKAMWTFEKKTLLKQNICPNLILKYFRGGRKEFSNCFLFFHKIIN